MQPPPAPGRFHISFGAGLVVGAWLNHDCDWGHHEVIVWHHDHPRPVDWWYRSPNRRETPAVVNNVTVVNNTTIVNQNVTVWHPQARGAVANRGDRGWGAQDVRGTAPARNEAARPAREDVRQPLAVAAQKPVPRSGQQASAREATPGPRSNQPIPAPKDPRPVPAPVTAKQPPVATSGPRPAVPPATSPLVANAPVRAPSGALAGIESSRATREASARGQQSRERIAKPVAPSRPAPVPPPKANPAETKRPQKAPATSLPAKRNTQ